MDFNRANIPDEQNEQIQCRLDLFVYKRAIALSIVTIIAFVCYLWVLEKSSALTPLAVVFCSIAVALNVYRIWLAQSASNDLSTIQRKHLRRIFEAVSIAISVLWVGIYCQANMSLGNDHPTNFLALLIISGLIGGTPSSLGPMQKLAVINTLVLGGGATISTIINGSSIHDYILASLSAIYTALMVNHASDFRKTLGLAMLERSTAESEINSIKTLINSVPGYMTILDKDLNYVMANDAFTKFVKSDVIGKKVGHLNEKSEFKALVEQFASSSFERKNQEMKMGSDFDQQHYLVSLAKIHSPFEGIAVLTMNIEDRVQMELELTNARQEMEHASRLITIGEMVSSISHEIRNPLTIIAGKAAFYKMIVTKKQLDPDKIANEADIIIKMVDRISKIIQTTLRFSRGEKDAQMKPTSIRQIIEDATTLISAKTKVEMVDLNIIQGPALDIPIQCQPLQISQVIVNLISNGIDAMEHQQEKWIRIEVIDLSDKIRILVSDGGAGIPIEVREKMMQPFFTTKAAGMGTGLGLSISQNILMNHQGQLMLLPDTAHTTFAVEMWKEIPHPIQNAG